MAKAYSDDLRRKFIEAHQQGEGSWKCWPSGSMGSAWAGARRVSATFRAPAVGRVPPVGPGEVRAANSRCGGIRRQVGAWIAEQPDLTACTKTVAAADELRLRASIGRPMEHCCVESFGAALKKKSLYAAEQDTAASHRRRSVWREQVRRIDPERLIFLDESSVATEMTRRYGRASARPTQCGKACLRGVGGR